MVEEEVTESPKERMKENYKKRKEMRACKGQTQYDFLFVLRNDDRGD